MRIIKMNVEIINCNNVFNAYVTAFDNLVKGRTNSGVFISGERTSKCFHQTFFAVIFRRLTNETTEFFNLGCMFYFKP